MNSLKSITTLFVLFIASNTITAQVTHPRAWAEWEETDGIILHQPNFYLQEEPTPVELLIAEEWDSLYLDLIRGIFAEGVKIYYILDTTDRPEYHSGIIDTMNLKYGINIHHPDFLTVIGCKNYYIKLTKWTRDHGPMNVFKDQADSLYFFLFSDDAQGAGAVLRDYLNIPDTIFYQGGAGNIGSDGGNYIVDGHSTGIVNFGNGAVLPAIKQYFGLDTVFALTNYLPHVDYYLKLVNEETLIIASHQPDDYIYGSEPFTYAQDSAILAGLVAFFQEQVISQYGRPMKVYSIPNPPSVRDDSLRLWWYTQYVSYVNSLIVNRSVFIPQFNLPGYDSTAMSVYREAMPGYTVVPVFCRRGATAGGGVHCLTNSVAASDPVLIRHKWINDTVDQAAGYEIVAEIITRSGVSEAFAMWSSAPAGPFQAVAMQNDSTDFYSAVIPGQPGMTDLYYYISAGSTSGKTITKPYVAPGYTYHCVIRGGAPGWISQAEKAEGQLVIYPNPAIGQTVVDVTDCSLSDHSEWMLMLYDVMGNRKLIQSVEPGNNSIPVKLEGFAPGQYFLVISDKEGRFLSGKLLIHQDGNF